MVFHLDKLTRLGKVRHFLKVFFKTFLKPILICQKSQYHTVLYKYMLQSAFTSKQKNKGKDRGIWRCSAPILSEGSIKNKQKAEAPFLTQKNNHPRKTEMHQSIITIEKQQIQLLKVNFYILHKQIKWQQYELMK